VKLTRPLLSNSLEPCERRTRDLFGFRAEEPVKFTCAEQMRVLVYKRNVRLVLTPLNLKLDLMRWTAS